MNHKTNAVKAAGISAAQKENAPTEISKGASKKHRHSICKAILPLLKWLLFEAFIAACLVLAVVLTINAIYALLTWGAV
jgi:uncharacterized membrane protein